MMDTKMLMEEFFDIFRDDRFLDNDPDSLPYIANNPDDFLRKYIDYCQKIAIGKREKMSQIMDKKGISASNCQKKIVEKIKNVIDNCNNELNEEEKKILNWKYGGNSTDNFASIPKEDTVKKWLNDTGARNPNRLYLYKIAFALKLPAYYPYEISDSDEKYITSVNFLFNKIYNQKFCTKIPLELIFIFCLRNGKNYTTAMKMLAKYIRIPKNDKMQLDDASTLNIIKQSSSENEDEFIGFLVQMTPVLNDKYSSVFSKIEESIKYFSDENKMNEFWEKYSAKTYMNTALIATNDEENLNYMNLGKKVLISELLKQYLVFFNKRMRISSALYDKRESLNDTFLSGELASLGISNALYQCLKKSASESISAKFGNNGQQTFSDIINDIIITEKDVYNQDIIIRTENDDGKYTRKITEKDNPFSHELIYRRSRKALITAHFFFYWSATDAELSYDEYISEINEILTDCLYTKMYIKNSFDSFLMLLAKTVDPIESYYSVFETIFSIYDDYQKEFTSSDIIEEFSEYNVYTTENKADGNIDIVEHDMIHPVDQNSIQEKILKLIMGQK